MHFQGKQLSFILSNISLRISEVSVERLVGWLVVLGLTAL